MAPKVPPLLRAGAQPLRVRRRVVTAARSQQAATTCCRGLREALETLSAGEDLSAQGVEMVVDEILAKLHVAEMAATTPLTQEATAQMAALISLLRAKGEASAEIYGLARSMRKRMRTVDLTAPARAGAPRYVDIVGTGGDGANTINISTGSAILAAAAGAKVAKHGSRSVSSNCGSSDVLEELGIKISLGPESVARCVDETGIGFMFSPNYHPVMGLVAPIRKALKIRTIFNILGPLLNPAGTKAAVVGVYRPELMPLMAESLRRSGLERFMIVTSAGTDELTPVSPAKVLDFNSDQPGGNKEPPWSTYEIDPLIDFGIQRCTMEDLRGENRAKNAGILRNVLAGKKGPIADSLVLNAGAVLAVSGLAGNKGGIEDMRSGIEMARRAHETGSAIATLDSWRQLSHLLE